MTREGAAEKVVARGQEQAVAAWVDYLNQVRLDRLVAALREQEVNLHNALGSIDGALGEIGDLIASNRGGFKGMHGFIAEIAETGIGNARSQILGGDTVYQWVNDNGSFDLIRQGVAIQQKFSTSGGSYSLHAIAEHLRQYPDFIESGHRYQIPRDHYDVVRELYTMSSEVAGKVLSRSGDGPSYQDWRRVQAFFRDGSVPFERIEPSHLQYGEVQQGTYQETMASEKQTLTEVNRGQREAAHRQSQPSLKQGAQVAFGAAAVEGGTAFVLAVAARLRAGKRLSEFTNDDWSAIVGRSGLGFAKGGVRGLSIYTLTNATATSAAAASAIVTAAFGVADQANKLRQGEITEHQFIENAELVSLEAGVSVLSSLIGQAIIPFPILGAVIGNTVGIVMLTAVRDSLSKHEAALIQSYLDAQRQLEERLAAEYQSLVEHLDAAMSDYVELLGRAFSPDVQWALEGSARLARDLGVAPSEVLDSEEKIMDFFLG